MADETANPRRVLLLGLYAAAVALLVTSRAPEANRVGVLVFFALYAYVFLGALGIVPAPRFGRRFSLLSVLLVMTALGLLLAWARLALKPAGVD